MDLVGGGVDSRGGYVSKILYVKMKELGPLGGCVPGAPPPTRSTNGLGNFMYSKTTAANQQNQNKINIAFTVFTLVNKSLEAVKKG